MEEYLKAKKSLTEGKACGEDGIPPEILKPCNYRGIGLSSLVTKLYDKMILNRIRPKLHPLVRPYQYGLRTGRTTFNQILALGRVIEGIKEYNLKPVMTFIDFKKAFYMVHRGMMLKILKAYGIPDSLVAAIEGIYKYTRARVLTPDGMMEEFQIHSDGDTLTPYTFVQELII